MSALLFRIVWLLAFAGVSDGAAKVKRVKAGKNYKTHDAVHIVVNKVGYVAATPSKVRCHVVVASVVY